MKMTNIEKISKYYKAISDVTRLNILEILLIESSCICICELAKKLSKDQSVIYKHIQILKESGFINTVKRNKFLMCCIVDKSRVLELFNIVK